MLELTALFVAAAVLGAFFLFLVLAVGVLKLLFKIVLFPLGVLIWVFKWVILLPLALLATIVFVPVLLSGVLALALPLLVLAALLWAGCSLIAAA